MADAAYKMPAGNLRRDGAARGVGAGDCTKSKSCCLTNHSRVWIDCDGQYCEFDREQTDGLNAASIVVSHDIHETFAICDYVYIMHQSGIVAQGSPDELLLKRSVLCVASFTGAKSALSTVRPP